nr:aminopeptidase P family protein [Lachnospiraceae bacterium]
MDKFERIYEQMKNEDLDAILVSDGYNMRYISGFTGATGYLLITNKSKKLFTDSRYTIAAMAQAQEFEVITVDGGRNYPKFLNEVLNDEKIANLGFEGGNLTYEAVLSLKDKLEVKKFKPLSKDLSILRRVKRPDEVENLKMAEHIGDIAFGEILHHIKPGVTEIELAAKLEYIMKTNGAEKLSFETIIASGVNSSKPHAEPGKKVIEKGDFVTMDFGCMYNGYCSDMTRTVVVGKASEEQKKVYNIVRTAQQEAIDMAKAGLPGKVYDKVARDVITKEGYGDYFGHGLGHSVGLEIHENPRFSQTEEDIVEPGTIMTIEPGIYIPGAFG